MPRITVTPPGGTPQPYRFGLDTNVVQIGRSSSNDIVLDHGSVSATHCEMVRMSGGYVLKDCGSTNGILLNEERMEVIDLLNGMEVEVGDVIFTYELTEEEETSLSQEKQKKHQKKFAAPTNPSPAPAPVPLPTRTPVAVRQSNGAANFGFFMLFLVLAAFAFWQGLVVAHKNATKDRNVPELKYGRNLWEDIQQARK